jgi:hypothetical protein
MPCQDLRYGAIGRISEPASPTLLRAQSLVDMDVGAQSLATNPFGNERRQAKGPLLQATVGPGHSVITTTKAPNSDHLELRYWSPSPGDSASLTIGHYGRVGQSSGYGKPSRLLSISAALMRPVEAGR